MDTTSKCAAFGRDDVSFLRGESVITKLPLYSRGRCVAADDRSDEEEGFGCGGEWLTQEHLPYRV